MAKTVKINEEFVMKFVEENGFPEVGHFEEKKDLQKFYKHLSDEQLLDWIELEGLEFNPSESEAINRMRMCMAVLYSRFPKAPSTKKKAKYADYSLDDLVQMAIDKEVAYEVCDDERIHRMRAIMALRAAKVID